jgi:hypothetical protein
MPTTKGRAAPPEKLETWTSLDTGRTVLIRKVSTLLRAEIRRQVLKLPDFLEPQPPKSQVDYGDGTITVANRSHPEYQRLLLDWGTRTTNEVASRLKQAAIARGVVVADEDIDQGAVTEVREQIGGLDEYTDRYVYIAFVVVGSEDDWKELLAAIFERSAPQEAAIQAHIATFQPDLQGAPAVP